MSSLPDELKQALSDSISQLAPEITSNDFERLGSDAKQVVYKAIVNTLLGHDHQAVAKSLLDALQDDAITPSEWNTVLKAWAEEYADSNPVAKALLGALDDNEISQKEAIDIILKWIQSTIKNQDIINFIDGISTLNDTSDIQTALEKFLISLGWGDTIAKEISEAITTGKITAPQICLILAAWAAASGEEDLARILEKFSKEKPQDAKPQDIIMAAIGERLPSEVKAIFEHLLASDWNGLLAAILGALDPGFGAKILSDIAAGKYKEAAIEKLTQLLEDAGIKDIYKGPLVNAVIDLVTGTRSLFVSGPEADAPYLKTPAMVALWREIRSVIYMAQLACKNGALIPTNPQAQPHVFIAAQIRFYTPLHLLVPSNASNQQRDEFRGTLTAFLDVHFGDRMNPFKNVSVVSNEELQPDSDNICKSIYLKVSMRLR